MMAKVRGPLYSIDARGKIADSMVFGGWKGIAWVREYFIPQNPNTAEQQWIRGIFTDSVLGWQDLDAAEKAAWQTAIDAKGLAMSGFNYYMGEYIDAMKVGDTPSDIPPS